MYETIKTDEILDFFEENKDRVWIFIDTETLGFNADKHQLIEVAAKATRFGKDGLEELDCYHEKAKLLSLTRLRMTRPYNGKGMSYQDLMQMTNYGEPIKNRKYLEEDIVLEEVYTFISQFEDPILVAHNSPFDIKYLNTRHNKYFKNQNPYDEYEVLDTLKLMKRYFTSMVATEAKRFKHRWLSKQEADRILEMRRIRKSLQKKKKKRMSLRLGNVAETLGIDSDGWHSAKFDVDTLICTLEKLLVLFKDSKGRDLYPEKKFI